MEERGDIPEPKVGRPDGLPNEDIVPSGDNESLDDGTESLDSSESPEVRRQDSSAMIEDADRAELVRIATALSRRHSVATGAPSRIHTLATLDEDDPALDPKSDKFELSKWLQNFAKTLHDHDISGQKTGVAFKNLSVYGSGAAIQVQGTVGSWLLAPLHLGEIFSFGKKEPKQILHRFEGLIKSSELLVVLGRPGSGCSTLLKTICGELHGLAVDKDSRIHYDGIPQAQMSKEFKGEAIYNQEVCISSARAACWI